MKNDSNFHIFFQDNPDVELFTYGKAKYTRPEVDIMVKLLPERDKYIIVRWAPVDYPEWHPGHPKNRTLNTQINANNN